MLQFWLAEDDRSKVVSALVQVEARSAICRLRKESRMTSDEATIALDSVQAEVRRMIEQPLNPPVLAAATTVIDRHALRALDAIQLGCAIVARDLLAAPEMRFLTADKELLAAAKKEGFEPWNPAD
jgi:predicted nucleic acid-binding protein